MQLFHFDEIKVLCMSIIWCERDRDIQFYIGMPNTNDLEDLFEIDSEPYRTNACILKAHSHSKSGG
jgi:hypothetical protein